MTTSSSVRMKMGPVEFECTASEEFLKVELPVLISGLTQMYKENLSGLKLPDANHVGAVGTGDSSGVVATNQMTTTSIAAKLKVESGTELALAAALRLVRLGKSTFTRSELTDKMREATSFCTQNYLKNLSRSIQTLIGEGKLIESAKDTYALSEATKTDLEGRLAQS